MLKTKLFTAIALVAVLLLLAPAAYAAEGTTTGSFGAASQPPTVESIEIYSDAGLLNPVTLLNPMTPQATFYAKVTVSSPHKLKHLDYVKVNLFYNNSGNVDMLAPADPGGADTQVCAILTCTVGPPASWSMVPVGGGTTWSIVPGSCSQPVNLNTNLPGDWVFAFKPGEVAHEAANSAAPGPDVWDAQGKAIDKTPLSGEKYVRTKGMNFYGEITVNTAGVDWGVVPLGLTFDNDTYNPETGISITYLANGDYEGDIKSTDWAGATDNVTLDVTGSNPPGNPGEFGLEANSTSDNTTAVTVLKAAYTAIYATGTITPEGGDPPVVTNTLWLALSASGILPETYSGSIYYQIANR